MYVRICYSAKYPWEIGTYLESASEFSLIMVVAEILISKLPPMCLHSNLTDCSSGCRL